MAFYGVATHLRGVAGAERDGNAQPGPGLGISCVISLDVKAIGLQVRHPVLAAAAAWVFPDFDRTPGLRRQMRGQPGRCQGGHGMHNHSSLHHQISF